MRPAAAMNAASKVTETRPHPVVKSERTRPDHGGVTRAECDIAHVRRRWEAYACGNTWRLAHRRNAVGDRRGQRILQTVLVEVVPGGIGREQLHQ